MSENTNQRSIADERHWERLLRAARSVPNPTPEQSLRILEGLRSKMGRQPAASRRRRDGFQWVLARAALWLMIFTSGYLLGWRASHGGDSNHAPLHSESRTSPTESLTIRMDDSQTGLCRISKIDREFKQEGENHGRPS
jgi:hypothetical protein